MLNFIGIGAQKAGTTWLFANLAKHPELSFPAGKEIHFWDTHYKNGVDWYKNLFPDTAEKLQGEVTPAYAILGKERIKEVHRHFPDLKMIYITRNPIERAWSGALMALGRSELQLGEASDQWFIDHFRSEGSRKRGDYAACLDNWLSVYDKSQLLILEYEKMMANPRKYLLDVADFLKINREVFEQMRDNELKERHNEGAGFYLRISLYRPLRELYREPIARLNDKYQIDYAQDKSR